MKPLAALALAALAASCGSHPLGLREGDRILAVTLKSGQRITFAGYAEVTEIDGSLVTVSLYDSHLRSIMERPKKLQVIDFDSVASCER